MSMYECPKCGGVPGITACCTDQKKAVNMTEQLKTDPLFIFAQEVIHGSYKPEELKDAAMRAIRHHSAQPAQAVPGSTDEYEQWVKDGRPMPAQAGQVLSDGELCDIGVEHGRATLVDGYDCGTLWFDGDLRPDYRAVEAAVRAKMGVAVPMTPFTQAQLERLWLNTPETVKDSISRPRFKKLVQFVEAAHGIVGKEGGNG